ncbi:MAG: 16S rRNA (adenine(1518)-N(6)/adenine(1519)-N(6))-dimethyltransferase RsmA [Gammaproteobacteria bacterium]|nr:16S rRNA (adenine(1518)-N(6)/adenine(1519)-N(6))-dimethyltransferase RsmA [Gammaproteobacteria bacterium]
MNHHPRKRFGQNFLHDQNVLARMVQAISPLSGDRLVEIGPGEGALTCPLLKLHGELTAIELDRDLGPKLMEKCEPLGQFRLLQDDAMKFDYARLATTDNKIRIAGNLPYNISTPILFHLAAHAHLIKDMHVLLQKEVASRITAMPGSKTYGRLSVMMQLTFEVAHLFDVGPGAFRPPPKVQSTFIRLTPHQQAVVRPDQHKNLALVVSQAFSQRRKTLRNSLQPLLDADQIAQAGIDPSRRAETLTLREFAALAALLPASN